MQSSSPAIALIAHDGREQDLLEWWAFNHAFLAAERIYTNVPPADERPSACEVITIPSGADGGELKTGALIADGCIDRLIYFWHPKAVVAHDADVKALIRMAVHHDIVVACNRNSADHVISSSRQNPAGYFPESGWTGRRVALVAHDSEKDKLVAWCQRWRETLARHQLCGTGTTAWRIREATGLPVEGLRSGPDGGDFQLGARIVDQELDTLVFFWSTTNAQPHDVDVKALLRIAVQLNVAIACNAATADRIFESHLLEHDRPFHPAASWPAEPAAVAPAG